MATNSLAFPCSFTRIPRIDNIRSALGEKVTTAQLGEFSRDTFETLEKTREKNWMRREILEILPKMDGGL